MTSWESWLEVGDVLWPAPAGILSWKELAKLNSASNNELAMGFSSCLMCFLLCFEIFVWKKHEICSLPECTMRSFSDLWKTVDVSRALAISQKRKHDAMQLSKQTKGHKLHQIARWIKSTCLKLQLHSHSPHAPCTFNYFGASHGETNAWIEADITFMTQYAYQYSAFY